MLELRASSDPGEAGHRQTAISDDDFFTVTGALQPSAQMCPKLADGDVHAAELYMTGDSNCTDRREAPCSESTELGKLCYVWPRS